MPANGIWTNTEDQLLIDVFNTCENDALTAKKLSSLMERTEGALCTRLCILRKQGLIGDSNMVKKRKQTVETVLQPVKQASNNDLINIAKLITAMLNREEKQQLVMELIA